jgi:hypothetical protein
MNNNASRKIFKDISVSRGWKTNDKRNVAIVNGEMWSFSVYSKSSKPECRQTYEDTVGFIGLDSNTKTMIKYRIHDFAPYSVSRISPTGVKAYNVVVDVSNVSQF